MEMVWTNGVPIIMLSTEKLCCNESLIITKDDEYLLGWRCRFGARNVLDNLSVVELTGTFIIYGTLP